jgi:hypothetical protein
MTTRRDATELLDLSTDTPDRGYLLEEPCRYCRRTGGVYFVIDDSPFGRNTAQVVACDHCKANWTVDGPLA